MKKSEAKDLFGGRYARLAEALGLGRAAISEWPEELTTRQTHEIIGAAVLSGRIKGARLPECLKEDRND